MTAWHVVLIFRALASLFFVGLAFIFQGFVALMVYEAAAIWTRAVPTISLVTSFELLKHPTWWVVIACIVAFVLGALLTHFTHWTPS